MKLHVIRVYFLYLNNISDLLFLYFIYPVFIIELLKINIEPTNLSSK